MLRRSRVRPPPPPLLPAAASGTLCGVPDLVECLFSAHAQVAVGLLLVVVTLVQWTYWTVVTPPSVNAVFQVSMEALLFAAYAILATALGIRKTEHVEAKVVENIEQAEEVKVGGD